MKRDDFGMRIDQVRELATKYSKPELARMVKMGLVGPQEALMAGMMIDRIAKSAMQPPQTTVADDVFAPPMPQPGIMGAPGAPAPSAGVASLPSNLPSMAGGGIIAFDDGGEVEGYADGDLVSASDTLRRGLASHPAMDDAYGIMLPGRYRTRELTLPERTTPTAEVESIKEAERAAGYDPEATFRRMREEDAAQKGDFAKRREDAKAEAILMAGLGLIGARRGQEFEAFSGASRQALMQYKSDLNDIRKSEQDVRKASRELELAEVAAKRSRSEKAQDRLARRQDIFDAAVVERDKNYNQTVTKLADFFQDEKKVEKETATRMAIAVLDSQTKKDVAATQERGAASRVGMGNLLEAKAVLAELQKTNPNATYEDAYAVIRGGKAAGLVTDKEYQDAYEKRREGLIVKKQKEEFDAKYPTWREFAAEQRAQAGAGRSVQQGAAGSGFSEGQESKDTQGRPIVYRNGQWVYK